VKFPYKSRTVKNESIRKKIHRHKSRAEGRVKEDRKS
jgi:hypothetical protein